MNRQRLVLAVLLAMGLGACSTQDEEAASVDAASESKPQHLWKDQQKALQKAREVEQDLMDAFKRRDEEMEKQMR
ncbi:MAG: hypothetical protein BMS9Abin08_0391 [Gammaproteobacteria bacterium]|nr:MAG: hypothetical protein BMS9Abin08_0391 [Gammaproteobacteria bacterium]